MSVIHTVTRAYKDQSANAISQVEAVTGNYEQNLDDTVVVAANHQLHWACTRANLQSLCLYSSGAVTVYTNDLSTGSPQDTIPLAAGQTRVWTLSTDLIAKCPFSNDVTTIYVTNAGADPVTFRIRAILNQ